MVTSGLEEMTTNFLLRHKSWAQYGRTWSMLRQGRDKISQMDYWLWWEQDGIDLEGARVMSGAAGMAL